MKKVFKLSALAIMVVIVGVLTVQAAVISMTKTTLSVSSGGSDYTQSKSLVTGTKMKIDYDVMSIGSGTATTVFKAYSGTSASNLTLKATVSKSLAYACYTGVTIASNMTSGTWRLTSEAFSGSTKYASWSGSNIKVYNS